ncbi:TonB-dependent receptor [Vandammella animalimorsus]|uniref:TonB-dependent receptor n=1 Tax=Vandammella animalimorsus TaxID=2029117 RepID=UPI00325B6897
MIDRTHTPFSLLSLWPTLGGRCAPAPARARLRLTAAAVLGSACCAAWAQQTLPTVEVQAQPPASALGLAQPSESGSRTGLNAQQLPASLASQDEQTWRQRGDHVLADIVARTPGMTPQGAPGNGGMAFTTRGFSGVNSVGVAEDGLRLGVASGTVTYPSDSWGYERIEVLRGPAATVYGGGTVGGTINAVRKQPSRTRDHELLLGAGQHGAVRAGLGATGALGEQFSYRLDVYGHRATGQRELGRSSGGKLMSTLRWQPDARWQVDLLADLSMDKPERYFGSPVHDGRIVPGLEQRNYNSEDSIVRYEDRRLRARAQWQAQDWLTLRNELYRFSAHRHWKNIESYRYEPQTDTVARSSYLEIGHDMGQLGNRLEAVLELGAHRAVAGWEVSRTDFTHTNNAPYGGSSTVPARWPQHGFWHSPDPTLPKFDTRTTAHAFYLEDAWQVQPRWLVLAGLRRDVSRYSRHERVRGTPFDKTLGGTAWRLGLTHQLSAGTSLYGQFSQGHDPITSMLTLNLANRDFKLSTARQLEVGLKQQFGQGLGEWTAAAYRIEKKDIITRDADNPRLSVQGGRQSAKGLELQAVLRPHPRWQLEGNWAWVDARFDELRASNGEDLSGKQPANVPRQNANLWSHLRLGQWHGQWQLSLGARYVGARFANNTNTVRTPGHTVWDAALAWQLRPGATVRLQARNLADKQYTNRAISGSQALLGGARRFDLTAEWMF